MCRPGQICLCAGRELLVPAGDIGLLQQQGLFRNPFSHRFDVKRAIQCHLGLLQALAALYRHRVGHLDIKSKNTFIIKLDSGVNKLPEFAHLAGAAVVPGLGIVVLGDTGCMRSLPAHAQHCMPAIDNMRGCGTPGYMPPEVDGGPTVSAMASCLPASAASAPSAMLYLSEPACMRPDMCEDYFGAWQDSCDTDMHSSVGPAHGNLNHNTLSLPRQQASEVAPDVSELGQVHRRTDTFSAAFAFMDIVSGSISSCKKDMKVVDPEKLSMEDWLCAPPVKHLYVQVHVCSPSRQ